jgi:FtsP/CotA-like multicopper oxidase with cupredoxin domain
VVKNNGAAVPFTGYQDTKDVSPHGEAKLLVPFTRAVMAGRFVFHCHILSHEDHGMMATIVVRN